MNNTAQLLYDYLQNILRRPESATLALTDLPPDFRPLGQILIALQDSLCRMTKQAVQIANGDYTQRVNFTPGFSESFNAITAQLQSNIVNAEMEKQVLLDSIQALDDTSWELEKSNQELKNNLTLVRALTDYTNNMIFVYAVDTDQGGTYQPVRELVQKDISSGRQSADQTFDSAAAPYSAADRTAFRSPAARGRT